MQFRFWIFFPLMSYLVGLNDIGRNGKKTELYHSFFHSIPYALYQRSHPEFGKECFIPYYTHFSNLVITILHLLNFFKTFFLPLVFSLISSHFIPFSPTEHNISFKSFYASSISLLYLHYHFALLCVSQIVAKLIHVFDCKLIFFLFV